MSLRLLEPAQAELDEAIEWYAMQAPGLEDAFLLEASKAFRLIEQLPMAWHPLSENTRRCRLARFPYSIIYTVESDGPLVIAIAYLHRSPRYWRDRLADSRH